MEPEQQKPSFWHSLGRKYPAPTLCILMASCTFLLTIIGIGGAKIGEEVLTELAELRGLHSTITRIDTTVADVKERQDRTDGMVSKLIQIVMEQKRGR